MAQPEYVTFAAAGGLDEVSTWTPGDPPAWKGLNYTPWYRMGPRVGDDRPIPGTPGRLAVAREIDELRFSQQMRFNGRHDRTGAVNADPFVGVMASFLYFRKHVLDYLSPRSVTLHRRSGATSTGTAIIDGWEETVQSGGQVILLTFQVTIPAGSLVTP